MENAELRIVVFNLLLILNLFALNLPKYFSADFIQKIHSDNKVLTYKGKIYTDSKNVFWKYTYPNVKEIWITDKVYVYEPDLIQVTVSKKHDLNLFEALKKAKKEKNFYTADINDKKIFFIYDKTLKKIWYTDEVGNRVEISLTNQSDKKLPKKLFKPSYPKDVDIIYQH